MTKISETRAKKSAALPSEITGKEGAYICRSERFKDLKEAIDYLRFAKKVDQVMALLPSLSGTKDELAQYGRGVGYICHSPADMDRFLSGVRALLRTLKDNDSLADILAQPFGTTRPCYVYGTTTARPHKLMDALFCRLAHIEATASEGRKTEFAAPPVDYLSIAQAALSRFGMATSQGDDPLALTHEAPGLTQLRKTVQRMARLY